MGDAWRTRHWFVRQTEEARPGRKEAREAGWISACVRTHRARDARMCPCTREEVCIHYTTGLRDCANTCAFF